MTTTDPAPASSEDGELVVLGAVIKPHGVHGELRIFQHNPSSSLIAEQKALVLRSGDRSERYAVKAARPHGELVLLQLEGVSGREAAEALRGWEVCVPREALPPTEEEEWYFVDLIGLTARDEAGEELGEVLEVLSYPTIECLRIRAARGDLEVPLAKPYVVEVKLEEGVILLAHLEDFEPEPERPSRRGRRKPKDLKPREG